MQQRRNEVGELIVGKFPVAPGWTRDSLMARVREGNSGARCWDKGGCMYEMRYYDVPANHCAIGCFIPAGHPAMDSGKGVCNLLREFPELRDELPFTSDDVLLAFQNAHDRCNDTHDGDVYAAVEQFLAEQCVEAEATPT